MRPARGGLAVALAAVAGVLCVSPAPAQANPVAGRGELLYDTHCRACHSEQLHWRDRRAASDWTRLKQEVSRWQEAARLGWSEADIAAVARYLNENFYHLPQTGDGIAARPPAGPLVQVAHRFRQRPGFPP